MTNLATPPASDSEITPPAVPAAAPAAAPAEAAALPAPADAPLPGDAPAPGADDAPPSDATPTDPRATARLIKERDEARVKLAERDTAFAALESDFQARAAADRAAVAGGQRQPETAEERRARHDSDPYAFYEAERQAVANGAATDWLLSQPEASGNRQEFLARVHAIAQELRLSSDDPKRDAQIALHFYKSRFPAAAAPPTSVIRKDTLNPAAGATPAPSVVSDADFDKKLAELQRTDPEAAQALWAKERHKRGWKDDS